MTARAPGLRMRRMVGDLLARELCSSHVSGSWSITEVHEGDSYTDYVFECEHVMTDPDNDRFAKTFRASVTVTLTAGP